MSPAPDRPPVPTCVPACSCFCAFRSFGALRKRGLSLWRAKEVAARRVLDWFIVAGFQDRCLKPLGHRSKPWRARALIGFLRPAFLAWSGFWSDHAEKRRASYLEAVMSATIRKSRIVAHLSGKTGQVTRTLQRAGAGVVCTLALAGCGNAGMPGFAAPPIYYKTCIDGVSYVSGGGSQSVFTVQVDRNGKPVACGGAS